MTMTSPIKYKAVSTHSRLKAAGSPPLGGFLLSVGFNTQPPEGGWFLRVETTRRKRCFNTQPPEGGWTTIKTY